MITQMMSASNLRIKEKENIRNPCFFRDYSSFKEILKKGLFRLVQNYDAQSITEKNTNILRYKLNPRKKAARLLAPSDMNSQKNRRKNFEKIDMILYLLNKVILMMILDFLDSLQIDFFVYHSEFFQVPFSILTLYYFPILHAGLLLLSISPVPLLSQS